MNPLLDQFLAEARDLLDQAGEAVLDLERGVDPERVHQAFRAVHTIKGGSGLFDMEPVTMVVHTAEDLLDGIRDGRGRFDGDLADALLAAFDQVGRWLDALETSERLPPDAETDATALVTRLGALRPGSPSVDGASGSAASAPDGPNAPPDDIEAALFERWPEPTRQAIREAALDADGSPLVFVDYRPDPDCFYTGIDPLRLVAAGPGRLAVSAEPAPDVPALDALDPLRCNVTLHAVYLADPDEVRDNFVFVEDEVRIHVVATAPRAVEPPPPSLVDAARKLIAEQIESLGADGEPEILAARLRSSARIADAVARRLGLDDRADGALEVALEEADPTPLLGHLDEIAARIEQPEPPSGDPPEAAEPGPEVPMAADRRVQRHLKVEVERVDALMDLTGELVVAKNALPYLARRATETYASLRLAKELMEHYAVFSRICEELQGAVTSVRMMAVGNAFGRFPRLVRDLARKQGKEVALVLDGEDTEADKAIVEDLAEPLVHLVRNALDHGIEPPGERAAAGKPRQAVLRLSARPAADRVEIEVRDDGRGIDPARVRAKALARGLHRVEELDAMSDAQVVQLVFAPGFSTAERVSEVSGRGVGMDAVRSAVDAMGGSVRLDSTPGLGTSVTLTLPLSTAVSRIMMVEVASHTFGLPMSVICETLRVPATSIRRIKDRECVVVRGSLRPVYRLRELLALEPGSPRAEEHIVVMEVDGEEAAVIVDRLVEGMDVVMKPLAGVMAGVGPYRGTTLLGDGRVLLILDMEEVIRCP